MSKVLIIGGTGTISYPITKLLSESMDVTILNRGSKQVDLDVDVIIGDIYDEDLVIDGFYDVVINFLVFNEKHARRNIELFKGKTNQFIFISTNVVLNHHEYCVINENTPVGNRVSVYGQEKAVCERVFMEESDFPVTIVRPSHTFSKDRFPVSVKGKNTWTVIQRMIDGKEIIVHDMGQSIWPITHAFDFARLFVSLVGNEKANGEIYHIQNPELHTWDMIYQAIVSAENEEGKKTVQYFDFEILEASAEEGNKNPSKPVIKQIKELVAEVNTPIDFFDYFEIYDENTPFDELFYEFGWLELPLTPGVYKVEARVKNNDGVETVEFYDFKIVESLDELEEETEKEVEKETSKEDKKDSEKESSETKELPKAGTSSLGLPMLGLGVILKLISRKQ